MSIYIYCIWCSHSKAIFNSSGFASQIAHNYTCRTTHSYKQFLIQVPTHRFVQYNVISWTSCHKSFHTLLMSPPHMAKRGLTERMTSVSNHPYMKPMTIPARKAHIHWKNVPILSPNPSWILFTSLKRK